MPDKAKRGKANLEELLLEDSRAREILHVQAWDAGRARGDSFSAASQNADRYPAVAGSAA